MSRVVPALVLTSAMAAGAVVAVSSPAGAASTANVYVVVKDRACGKDKVRGILANVDRTGSTTTRWDNGDNIVYPQVRLGVRNQVSMQVRCDKRVGLFFWQTVGYRTVVTSFVPTARNQTFWAG